MVSTQPKGLSHLRELLVYVFELRYVIKQVFIPMHKRDGSNEVKKQIFVLLILDRNKVMLEYSCLGQSSLIPMVTTKKIPIDCV